jgi:hypothetical protein
MLPTVEQGPYRNKLGFSLTFLRFQRLAGIVNVLLRAASSLLIRRNKGFGGAIC